MSRKRGGGDGCVLFMVVFTCVIGIPIIFISEHPGILIVIGIIVLIIIISIIAHNAVTKKAIAMQQAQQQQAWATKQKQIKEKQMAHEQAQARKLAKMKSEARELQIRLRLDSTVQNCYSDEYLSQIDAYEAGEVDVERNWWPEKKADLNSIEKKAFIDLCIKNIHNYKRAKLLWKMQSKRPPTKVPAYYRLAMFFEREEDYLKGIFVCQDALECGAYEDINASGIADRRNQLTIKYKQQVAKMGLAGSEFN